MMALLKLILLTNTFDECKAISMIIKYHPDFPSNTSDTETKKLSTGGPQDAITNVKFTTKVQKYWESTYVVTPTKDWGITVNEKYLCFIKTQIFL